MRLTVTMMTGAKFNGSANKKPAKIRKEAKRQRHQLVT